MRSTAREQKIGFADRLGSHPYVKVGDGLPYFIIIKFKTSEIGGKMKKVAIIMGSDSDLPVVKKAVDTLKSFGVPYEAHIYSAHRSPEKVAEFVKSARDSGFGVIIAAAGMAAHLAGAVAENTTLPVIGIPLKSGYLNGMDALLSTVQMPSGMPVATVAIDGAVNAALLSVQILALGDETLEKKIADYRRENTQKVLEKDAKASAEL